MATIKLSAPAESIRGTTGKQITWYPRGGRQFIRKWQNPRRVTSIPLINNQNWMANASRYWITGLTSTQRSLWAAHSLLYPKTDVNGDTYYISGFNLFLATAYWCFYDGESYLNQPLPTYTAGENPTFPGGSKLELVTDGVASDGDVLSLKITNLDDSDFYAMYCTPPVIGQVPKPYFNKMRLISNDHSESLKTGVYIDVANGFMSSTRADSPYGHLWPYNISESGEWFIRFMVQTLNSSRVPNPAPTLIPGGFITITEA